jgi:molybdopterin-containing oxidoreductase family iron-sulfur binding subunit
MEKCTFCIQRIRHAEDTADSENRAIRDGEVVPACAQACPADAIVFGRIDDPNSRVSQKGLQSRGYKQLEELGTLPRVTYLKGESDNGSNS